MYKKNVIIRNKTGLHARPVSMLVEKAMQYVSDISINFNNIKIDAKEVIDIITANINYGDEICIEANGVDEEIAVNDLVNLLEMMDE